METCVLCYWIKDNLLLHNSISQVVRIGEREALIPPLGAEATYAGTEKKRFQLLEKNKKQKNNKNENQMQTAGPVPSVL